MWRSHVACLPCAEAWTQAWWSVLMIPHLTTALTTFLAGVRGLFTGYLPTLMEDVPDMAFKFASYETLRNLHTQIFARPATAQVDSSTSFFFSAFSSFHQHKRNILEVLRMPLPKHRWIASNAGCRGISPLFIWTIN